jgi:ADP-ribose pyrophosphatase YjhB (NUDIX family)
MFCGRQGAMVNRLGSPQRPGGPPLRQEQQEARWATISVPGTLIKIGATLREAVDQPFDEITGTQTRQGFVLVRTVGKERTICEVQLAAWEGGTQIQIAIPRDRPARELEAFHEWIRRALCTDAKS